MKKALIATAIAMATVMFCVLAVRSQEVDRQTKDVMKFKLHFAQGVLEGIATENFDLIATNAAKLKALSQQASWQIRATEEYQHLTTEFARCADSLAAAAKNKNVDAATVAYFQMTVSCTTCHKYLRNTRRADAGTPSSLPLAHRLVKGNEPNENRAN